MILLINFQLFDYSMNLSHLTRFFSLLLGIKKDIELQEPYLIVITMINLLNWSFLQLWTKSSRECQLSQYFRPGSRTQMMLPGLYVETPCICLSKEQKYIGPQLAESKQLRRLVSTLIINIIPLQQFEGGHLQG